MNIDFEKVAEAIEKSSPEIKNLMFSTELGDKIGTIAEENKLEEETAFKLIDEVGYVILGLKSRSSFFSSLTEIGIDKDMAQKTANKVETEIFTELDEIKKDSKENFEKIRSEKPEETKPQNGVGDSFEQIILNQAKAMRPARPTDESDGIMNYESRIMEEKKESPNNLPKEPQKPKMEVPDYTNGDPYREPIE